MNPELQRIYDSLPEDEPKSRLEPYRELILRWRRQGRSHKRIAGFLRDQCKIRVSGEAVRKFVKLRSRPRKPAESDIDLGPAEVQPVGIKRLSAKERQARLDFVRSLNTKTDLKEEQPKSGWDELEPETVSYQPKGAR